MYVCMYIIESTVVTKNIGMEIFFAVCVKCMITLILVIQISNA